MPDAWEIRPTIENRTLDNITTFILFCEDEISEPVYFEMFQKEKKVKVNSVANQKSKNINLLNTISYCVNNGLMESVAGGHRLKDTVTEHIWCVYDRDAENEDFALLNANNQHNFSQSIVAATNAGLKVAWSNDAFELWLLLHFEEIAPGQWRHRNYIYDRLTDIFRNLPEQSADMRRITQNQHFSYKLAMKKRLNFINFVRPFLKDRLNIARERAINLEGTFHGNVAFHNRNPCTYVHYLVDSILSFHQE